MPLKIDKANWNKAMRQMCLEVTRHFRGKVKTIRLDPNLRTDTVQFLKALDKAEQASALKTVWTCPGCSNETQLHI